MITDPASARILLFAPEARLWPSYRLQLSIVDAWHDLGADLYVVGCTGVFEDLCPVMQAAHLTALSPTRERRSFCRECTAIAGAAAASVPATFVNLDTYVTTEMRDLAEGIVAEATPQNWTTITVDDIGFGRHASYLSMLTYKVRDVAETQEAWEAYRIDLRNSVLTYLATKVMTETIRPTHGLVYDRLYPTHRAFLVAMRSLGVPTVGVTAGSFIPRRYSTAVFHPFPHASQTLVDSSSVRASLDIPMTSAEIADVTAHIAHLIAGQDPWVYSTSASRKTPAQIRAELGIDPDVPVGVVLVGSPDETRSSLLVNAEFDRSRGEGVSDVVEFVETSLAAARLCPTTSIIIRLHPRLAPNKRDRLTSPDLLAIKNLLADAPPNVMVNAPGDGIGLYDVMRIADFGVNHASTSGLEFAAFGVPIVHVDPVRLNAYPPDFGISVPRGDIQGLASTFETLSHAPWAESSIIPAWRWMATVHLRVTMHQSEVGTASFPRHNPPMPTERRDPRRFIPEGIRRSLSRRLAWRGLLGEVTTTLSERQTCSSWAQESWDRFVAACHEAEGGDRWDRATDHTWQPATLVRGEISLGPIEERAQVIAAINCLVALLGPTTDWGTGIMRAIPGSKDSPF